ncbi:MAG TPA: WYL domain-containing protein, partial [Kofleriaceae bacterium]|nr:WYL domain-containing protein [Kofleriaceae bacterium]
VKAALSTSAQREVLQLIGELQLIGVPALPVPLTIQNAVETAWFESRALRIVYTKASGHASPRLVRIRNLVFDRSVTLLNCVDLETGNDRQFRLDRIEQAQVMDPQPAS